MPAELEFQANVTPYEYIGDDPAFGSLQLTMLARSFEQLQLSDLDILFPTKMSPERSLVIEQRVEGHGIMPPVAPGIPNGQFVEPDRMRRFNVVPQVFREDDTIDRLTANQLRRPGTINEQLPLQELMSSRVQKLVSRHKRTRQIFQAKMLQGGWRYYDERTKVSIDVSSNIPQHNLFSYKGWNDTVTAGSMLNVMGRAYEAHENMAPTKGRPEASFFVSTDGRIGVPWTYPQADIVRTLKQILNYLYLTNKNRFDTLVMNSQLLSVISSINEYFKAFQGIPGMLVNNLPTSTVAGNAAVGVSASGTGPIPVSFGPGGDITAIAGLKIIALDGIWRNPANDNQLEVYWPSHKVALVASQSMSDPAAKLGHTYHCSGEAWDGKPGLWIETDMGLRLPSQGIHISAGDCFIPFPVYPHWIALLDVCDPAALYTSLPILPDLGYGTF
jgi:hypothetical protein